MHENSIQISASTPVHWILVGRAGADKNEETRYKGNKKLKGSTAVTE
jgi:hypothetical protein